MMAETRNGERGGFRPKRNLSRADLARLSANSSISRTASRMQEIKEEGAFPIDRCG